MDPVDVCCFCGKGSGQTYGLSFSNTFFERCGKRICSECVELSSMIISRSPKLFPNGVAPPARDEIRVGSPPASSAPPSDSPPEPIVCDFCGIDDSSYVEFIKGNSANICSNCIQAAQADLADGVSPNTVE